MKITKLLLPESQPAHALLVRAKKVVLTYAQRVKTPAEFSVDGVTYENALGDVPPLEVGDVLVDEKGSFLVVEAAPDEIMKVSGDHELMQEAVYAFTARGIRVAPTEDGFAIMANDTFRSMLENVGLKTETVTEPFVPVALPQPHHGGCGCGCGGDEECGCGCGHHHHDDECGCGCGHHHHEEDTTGTTANPTLKPAAATTKTTTTVTKTSGAKVSKPKTATATTAALPKTGDTNWIAASVTLFLLGTVLLAAVCRC